MGQEDKEQVERLGICMRAYLGDQVLNYRGASSRRARWRDLREFASR